MLINNLRSLSHSQLEHIADAILLADGFDVAKSKEPDYLTQADKVHTHNYKKGETNDFTH